MKGNAWKHFFPGVVVVGLFSLLGGLQPTCFGLPFQVSEGMFLSFNCYLCVTDLSWHDDPLPGEVAADAEAAVAVVSSQGAFPRDCVWIS